MKQVFLLLIILGSLCLEDPALAQTYKLQDLIAAYSQGNYQHVISIGVMLTQQNPNDPRPHYYLANAYVRLGQTKEAIEEYSFCDKITQDPQLKSYCNQALNELISNTQSNQSVLHAAQPAQAARTNQILQLSQRNNQDLQDQMKSINDWYPDSKFFNYAPLPPPPFPSSAIKGAEKALQQKVN